MCFLEGYVCFLEGYVRSPKCYVCFPEGYVRSLKGFSFVVFLSIVDVRCEKICPKDLSLAVFRLLNCNS